MFQGTDPNHLQQRKDDSMMTSREYLHPPSSLDDVVSPLPDDEDDDYYRGLQDDEDDDDEWGGGREEDASFVERTSSIQRLMLEDDDELDEDELDEDEGVGGGTTYYDRSPGEVYTIPEEEEDATSPSMMAAWDAGNQLNPDTASSLLRWRGEIPNKNRSSLGGNPIPPPLQGMFDVCCVEGTSFLCFFFLLPATVFTVVVVVC